MNDKQPAGLTLTPTRDEQRLAAEILRNDGLSGQIKAEAARQKLRKLVPDVWELQVKPVTWVVPDLIASGALTIVSSRPGLGKTWLALQVSKALSNGGEVLGRRVEVRETLYCDRENSLPVMRERLDVLDFERTSRFYLWGLHCELPPPLVSQPGLYLEFTRMLAPPPLIVFDSFIRFHTAKESDATEMAGVIAHLRSIAQAGAAVVVLHHHGWFSDTRSRGSSDIEAGFDECLTLRERNGLIALESSKNRFGPPVSLTLAFDLDSGGFSVTEDPLTVRRKEELRVVSELIGSRPGLSSNAIERELKGRLARRRIREILRTGGWVTRPGDRHATGYFPRSGFLAEL